MYPESGEFASLRFTDPGELKRRCDDVQPFCGFWMKWPRGLPTLACEIVDPSLPLADFVGLEDYPGAFAVRPELWHDDDDIVDATDECNQDVPILLGDERWVAVNLIYICNCLDTVRSRYQKFPDGSLIVERYVLKKGRVTRDPFKIPETACCDMFIGTEGDFINGRDFYAVYHRLGLTGLRFEKVETL